MSQATVNPNGSIAIRTEDGALIPATMESARAAGTNKIEVSVEEAKGRNPVIRMEMTAIIAGHTSLNLLSKENALDISTRLSLPPAEDISALLREFNVGRFEFLNLVAAAEVDIYGECIAVNPSGPIIVKWDHAINPSVLTGWKPMRANGQNPETKEGFILLMPRDVVLPKLPLSTTLFSVSKDDEIKEAPIVVSEEMPDVAVLPVSRATLMMSLGRTTITAREQALIDMGVVVERYQGVRPKGIKFPPKGSSKEIIHSL